MNRQLRLIKYFNAQMDVFIRNCPVVLSHPSGRSLHELRLATRRLRATLWVLRHSSAHFGIKRLNRSLKSLGNRLGKVRELDVAIKDAKKYRIDSSNLEVERNRAQKQLRKVLNQKNCKHIIHPLIATRNAVSQERELDFTRVRSRLQTRLTVKLKQHINGQIELHRLRIILKKTQYALESMGQAVAPLRQLQDILGDAHDLEFLRSVVRGNVKLKRKQESLNEQATRLIKSALSYAIAQLEVEPNLNTRGTDSATFIRN